jgi:hypothetical protein
MKLITTITWTLEQEIDDQAFADYADEGHSEEEVKKMEEQNMYNDVIDCIEGRIDNLCLSNWSRDSVVMNWEE